jgi:hypothetical protein
MSEEAFQFLTVLTHSLRINLQMVSLSRYIYPFDLFRIESLIVHSLLNDVVLI